MKRARQPASQSKLDHGDPQPPSSDADRTGEWSSVDLTGELIDQRAATSTVDEIGKFPALAIGLAGTLAVFGIGATAVRSRIERSLVTRSATALNEAGIVGASVSYSGRDATVKVPVGVDPAAVAAVVRTKGAAPDAPHYSGPRSVRVVIDKTSAPIVTTTVVPVEPGSLNAMLASDGKVTVTGAVDSAEALAALQQGVAQQSPAITVEVEAEIRPGGVDARTATWVGRSIGELARVGASTGSVVADSSGLTVAGSVPTLAIRDAVNAFVRTSGLEVTGTLAIVRPADSRQGTAGGDLFGEPPIEAKTVQTQVNEVLAEANIQFRPDSAKITAEGLAVVSRLAAVLKSQPAVRFTVVGHTDNNGSPQRNLTLSVARADAVRDELVKQGLDPAQITTLGEGDSKPLVANDSPAHRRQNRRIEVMVSPR